MKSLLSKLIKHKGLAAFALTPLSLAPLAQSEIDKSGYLEAEFRYYPSEALFENQDRFFYSLGIAPELEWTSDDETHQVTFKPFGRFSSSEGNRSHADIREFYYLYAGTGWQIEAGINKVYWGVAESAHLVDVINQTNVVEAFNGEEKLGQPLIGLGLENAYGNFDFYVLPYFRKRELTTYDEPYLVSLPGLDRPLDIDEDKVLFESKNKESNIDLAARWAQSFNDLDVAISVFHGIDREGLIVPATLNEESLGTDLSEIFLNDQLTPEQKELANTGALFANLDAIALYYQNLTQIGLELQYLYDDLIFKFEGTSKYQTKGNYLSYVTGIEYTFADVDMLFGADAGILVEYLWNNRKDIDLTEEALELTNLEAIIGPDQVQGKRLPPMQGNLFSPFENDVFIGTRFNLNNVDSTQFVAGIIHDLESHTQMSTFEGSTRIGDSVRISINAYFLTNVEKNSALYYSRRDDMIEFKTAWFF